ncbi:ankyrin [Byssothecium circinans]|uniref:Ankyrin n=1 Tax=Byssothecium circinans TaxID=147558 RepID=A0A6A5TTB1_9PLEO|nr:ankyrin [Byssothecium circinans]
MCPGMRTISAEESFEQTSWLLLGLSKATSLATYMRLKYDIHWWTSYQGQIDYKVSAAPKYGGMLGIRGVRDLHTKSAVTEQANSSPTTTEPLNGSAAQGQLSNDIALTCCVLSVANRELLLAQHLFANFMWSVARFIPTSRLYNSTTTPPPTLIQTVAEAGRLRNAHELGSEETIGTLIIPSLSWRDALPYHSLTELISTPPPNVKLINHLCGLLWEFAFFHNDNDSAPLAYSILANLEETHLAGVVDGNVKLELRYHGLEWMINVLRGVKTEVAKVDQLFDVIRDLRILYQWQRREDVSQDELPDLEKERLYRLFGYDDSHVEIFSQDDANLSEYELNEPSDRFAGEEYKAFWDKQPRLSPKERHPFARDILGWTPLHYAVAHRRWTYVQEYAELIRQSTEDVPKDIAGRTPVHYAAMDPSFPDVVVKRLMWRRDCAVKDRCGMTPLHFAAKAGNVSAIDAMLDWIFRDTQTVGDNEGRTPLHWAATGNVATFERLARFEWKKVVDTPEVKKDNQRTDSPLHYAVWYGKDEVVEYLASNLKPFNIMIDQRNRHGKTALYEASVKGYMRKVVALLKGHADPRIDDPALVASKEKIKTLLEMAVKAWDDDDKAYDDAFIRYWDTRLDLVDVPESDESSESDELSESDE